MTAGHIDLAASYVLHRRPYRDTSLIVDVLSRDHGRVALVARGARQSRRGGSTAAMLEPFMPLLVSWRQGRGEMGTLVAVEPAGSQPTPLVGESLYAGFYANELLLRLLHRYDSHPELFEAYRRLLAELNPGAVAAPLRRFEKTLLEALGYGLMLTVEAETGEPVRPDQDYLYRPESGPAAVAEVTAGSFVISGRLLWALAEERFTEQEAMGDVRRLLSLALDPLLGHEPLRSRALLRRMRQAY